MPEPVKVNKRKKVSEKNLSTFAAFVLENYLDEFAADALNLSVMLRVPLLEHLKELPPEQLKKLVTQSTREFLSALAKGKAKQHTAAAVNKWLSGQLPIIDKHQVVADDISLVARVRKQALVNILPKYTDKLELALSLVDEIDDYILDYTTSAFHAFRNLAEERIREQAVITNQKIAELNEAQAITHIGNYVWDLQTGQLTWSDELYRIYGIEPGAHIPDSSAVRVLNHPDDEHIVWKHIDHSKRTLEPFDFHYRIILPDQTIRTLHARGKVVANEQGAPVKMIGTAQDVTAQKELERKLLENQLFIQKIADATPSLIASYNVHTGKYIFINQGVRKVLGYDPEVVLDRGIAFFMEILHPDDANGLFEKNSAALKEANSQSPGQTEKVQEFQYRLRHADGEYRWVHTFGTILDRNSKNEVENVLNISLDITERVRAEEKLLLRTAELQHSNSSLEEFAYVASHDLKEPLRKIITFADRLVASQKAALSDEGKSYLDKVLNSSIRMQQMISDLLSLSVITADKAFVNVSLRKVVEEVLMTFEHKIEETKAKIACDELPEAYVVPSQIRQLFQNLISNSLKFAREGVPPLIRISHRYLSAVDAATYDLTGHSRYLQLEVADNGIGFDNSFVDKIFAIFQRLHQRELYEGTGIGLAICKKIAENHNGVISATGFPGIGATFVVIIPQ